MELFGFRDGAARMNSFAPFDIVTIPPIAAIGTITAAAGTTTATGQTANLAALVRGKSFMFAGIPRIWNISSDAVDIGGGACTFEISPPASGEFATALAAWSWDLADADTENILIQQSAIGTLAGRATYNAQADGFAYLDITTPAMWERNGAAGTWTNMGNTVVLWIATTGSDVDGSAPLATVQRAIDLVATAGDLSGWNIIIALKAGTYAPFVLKEIAGAPAMLKICGEASLSGTPASLSSYVISSASPIAAIQATNLKDAWTLEGFTLTASKGHLLQAKGARLRFNQLRFGAAPGAHIAALSAGSIVLSGNGYEIAGGANAHLLANGSGGTVDLQAEATVAAPTVTISAASAFKTAFAWARASGHIFTGTGLLFVTKSNATGRRWRAEQNSSIDSGQSGEKYLPGTAGTAGNGVAVKNGEYI
jgi:hypothetical protein